jgi:hypothetical protein
MYVQWLYNTRDNQSICALAKWGPRLRVISTSEGKTNVVGSVPERESFMLCGAFTQDFSLSTRTFCMFWPSRKSVLSTRKYDSDALSPRYLFYRITLKRSPRSPEDSDPVQQRPTKQDSQVHSGLQGWEKGTSSLKKVIYFKFPLW